VAELIDRKVPDGRDQTSEESQMKATVFDAIARDLGGAATRRGLLRLFSAALGSGLILKIADVVESKSKGRRHRQGRAQHHGQVQPRRRKGKKGGKKKSCKPRSLASDCAGRCGQVQINCNRTVDCGCCDSSSCAGATPICVDKTCVACSRHDQCGLNSLCLDTGVCQPCTVTCPGGTCDGAQLRTALNEGGTVYACPGRYTGSFNMPRDVTLIGAGDGTDPASNTILDGQNSTRVLIPFGNTMAISRVRVTGGRNGGFGAGVYHLGRTLTMTDCTVADNANTMVDGGGVYNQGNGAGSSLTMTRCNVIGNDASGSGAGIYTIATLNLIACQISQNTAGSDGGGIFVSGGNVTLDACNVTDNHARNAGGVRSNVAVTVRNGTTITGNTPNNCPGGAVPGCTG
jgi:hypothetical protein